MHFTAGDYMTFAICGVVAFLGLLGFFIGKPKTGESKVPLYIICAGLILCAIGTATVMMVIKYKDSNYKCYKNWYSNVHPPVEVTPNLKTPKGILVDTTGVKTKVDLKKLDDRIDAMSVCLMDLMKAKPKLNEKEKQAGNCNLDIFDGTKDPIKRDCLIIKVVPVYKMSANNEWQLLNAPAPDEVCMEKGLKPTVKHPCMWRSAIQDQNVLITPPALYLWDIVRMATGCNNMWKTHFSKCAMK
jgi:hypothetical protein